MAETRDAGPEEESPVEVEWQFDALDLRPVERWLANLPSFALDAVDPEGAGEGGTITALARQTRRLADVYLDTEDWRMTRAGLVLRTRRRGRHVEATLKDRNPAGEGGLRRRLEVTEVLPQEGIGSLGRNGPVGRRLHAVVGARPLGEVFQVRTRRRPFALRVGGVDAAEVALDDTTIVVGDGQRPMQLRRVEVEVRPQWVGALEPVVNQLRSSCGLQPAHLSKFEAGLLAVGQAIPGPADLGSTEVSPTSTIGELAFAVLRRQVGVLRDKEPGTRLGEDPEELHDMRVATRRLRAALDVFGDVLPARARTLRNELGWLGSLLGAVRDLDVQLEGLAEVAPSTAAWATSLGLGDHDPLSELSALLEREREAARAELLSALDSVRWERLARGLSTMVQQGPLRRSAASRAPAAVAVPDLVVARHKAVNKAIKRARKSGLVPDYHRLRIRCKRLRYSLEFSSQVYEGRTSRFVRELTRLQDQLGEMQDGEVAASRLAHLAGESDLPPATVFVMGALAERHRRDVSRLLRRAPKRVARVGGSEWRDLADLMERRKAEAQERQLPPRRTLQAVPAASSAPQPTTSHPAGERRDLSAVESPVSTRDDLGR